MERFIDLLKQYRYGLLILILGIGLMLFPLDHSSGSDELPAQTVTEQDISASLEEILGKMDGVGRVQVLLTRSAGELTLYQTDVDMSSDRRQENTVLVTDGSRAETGLIRQIIPPTYLGAIIVCQGGDRPSVKLAVVEAVAAVTGLTADKIRVLKMK